MKHLTTCLVIVLTGAAALAQPAAERIELPEFKTLHADKKVLVVDVRDAYSDGSGHIPGAINIPLGEEEQAVHFDRLKAEKRPIVTYCA